MAVKKLLNLSGIYKPMFKGGLALIALGESMKLAEEMKKGCKCHSKCKGC